MGKNSWCTMKVMADLQKAKSVKRFRTRLRMTQEELAELLGITRDRLASIERGTGKISPEISDGLSRLGWVPDESLPVEAPVRVRASRRQLMMLVAILADIHQPPAIRETAELELRAALDLSVD